MTSAKPNKGCVLELQFASVKILFYSWLQRGDEMDASDPNRILSAEGESESEEELSSFLGLF